MLPLSFRSQQQLVHELDDLGAIPTANSSREQVLLSLDVLRNSLPEAMELLADVVRNPVFGKLSDKFKKSCTRSMSRPELGGLKL